MTSVSCSTKINMPGKAHYMRQQPVCFQDNQTPYSVVIVMITITHYCLEPSRQEISTPIHLSFRIFVNIILLPWNASVHSLHTLICMCDYRRGLDWILTTYTHDSELQLITAPSLIFTLYKSSQHT
jgi:hypothetical protein